jgi:predicted RNA-binding protein
MAYYLDLFSPDTQAKFSGSDRTISGFRVRQRNVAARVKPGDKLLCYLTRLSRWVGVLEVTSTAFEDSSPIFTDEDDPFVVRFKVKPVVWLAPEQGLPIHDKAIWSNLSLTRNHSQETSRWTGFFRGSLNHISDDDGEFLEQRLVAQQSAPKPYPLTDQDRKALAPLVARRPEGAVTVTVPDDSEEQADEDAAPHARESIKVQALLGRIGATMGFKVWLPANDQGAVLGEWAAGKGSVVDELPLNYDTTTLDTIERIDVLWLKGRSIVRAFEVEHTTAIYSGLLRMADLISLQPNMAIKLHIVAPEARRAKVLQEIKRPVFSLLEGRPLAKTCTYLSYDSVKEIAGLPHLAHVNDSVLDEYCEEAGDE